MTPTGYRDVFSSNRYTNNIILQSLILSISFPFYYYSKTYTKKAFIIIILLITDLKQTVHLLQTHFFYRVSSKKARVRLYDRYIYLLTYETRHQTLLPAQRRSKHADIHKKKSFMELC